MIFVPVFSAIVAARLHIAVSNFDAVAALGSPPAVHEVSGSAVEATAAGAAAFAKLDSDSFLTLASKAISALDGVGLGDGCGGGDEELTTTPLCLRASSNCRNSESTAA